MQLGTWAGRFTSARAARLRRRRRIADGGTGVARQLAAHGGSRFPFDRALEDRMQTFTLGDALTPEQQGYLDENGYIRFAGFLQPAEDTSAAIPERTAASVIRS